MTRCAGAPASAAETRARTLRDDLLATALLTDGNIVAYYETDQGLRCFGQFSLVQGNKPGYGLVIGADGAIPRDAEAWDMLQAANVASRADRI